MSKYVREVPVERTRKWKHFMRYFNAVEGPVLDVGCSHGNFAQHRPQQVVGIDGDTAALAVGRRRDQRVARADFAGSLPFRSRSFAAVNCDSVIEHVPDPYHLMAEIYRVLEPGGHAVVITPDLYRVKLRFWTDATHRHPFTPESLEQLCLDLRFVVVERRHQAMHYLKALDGWSPGSPRERILRWLEDRIAGLISNNLLIVARRPRSDGDERPG